MLYAMAGCKGISPLDGSVIACGSDKVILVDVKKRNTNSPNIIWAWQPSDARSLPLTYKQKYFNKIDECKPIAEGQKIMITSSTGGVAIIDKPSKDVTFFSYVANAHSIEELPHARVAVAGSHHDHGNCIAIFNTNRSGMEPVYKIRLYAAHGLVWDSNRRLLYALGDDTLKAYKLMDWYTERPKLKLYKEWNLKDTGGHDLVRFSSRELLVTTRDNVWIFNKEMEEFNIFKPLGHKKNIKGLSISGPHNPRIAFVQAEEKWWSHHIHLTNPMDTLSIPFMNLYKVRWWNYKY